jgi:hypothetical protein
VTVRSPLQEAKVKKSKEYRVKVTVGDATLEIHGAESGVVRIVEALSDVLRGGRKSTPVAAASVPSSVSSAATRPAPTDIRTFFEVKKPSSDVEAATAAAYYYAYAAPERDKRETIDAELLQEAFRLARRPLPSRTIFTLNNARNAGYLDSAGEGQFRLNAVGYNLVEHALGGEGGSEKVRRKPKPKKPRRK